MVLILGMFLIPLIYCGIIMLYQKRNPLCSFPEIMVVLSAELAFWGLLRIRSQQLLPDMLFGFLFIMLAAMTAFCMIDYWEQIVPNKMLFTLLMLFILIVGLQSIRDRNVVLKSLPSIFLGFCFSMISFGAGYLLSHKNMGAGDVKLALVMGLYLTGEYVVGAILYGCIAAALFSMIQLVRKKISRKDTIPFVPFLYIGLVIKYLAG